VVGDRSEGCRKIMGLPKVHRGSARDHQLGGEDVRQARKRGSDQSLRKGRNYRGLGGTAMRPGSRRQKSRSSNQAVNKRVESKGQEQEQKSKRIKIASLLHRASVLLIREKNFGTRRSVVVLKVEKKDNQEILA